MNTLQFMDKQIMDLSNSSMHGSGGSSNNNNFIDLMDPPQDDPIAGSKKDDILPSYDFQPLRPSPSPVVSGGASSPPSNYLDSGNARAWSSADSKTNLTTTNIIRNYGSLDSNEPSKVILDKDRRVLDMALVSEIDRTMKKHAENLLHALEGVSARLSQLETRTRQIENSVDDLKVSVGTNHGGTDGKLRQLENILREVQSGVDVIKDKQEILEAQLHLAKLQVYKVDQQAEAHSMTHVDLVQPAASAPQQCHQQLPPVSFTSPTSSVSPHNAPSPIAFTHPSSTPLPNAPPPPSLHNPSPPVQPPNQFSQNQVPSVPLRDSYFSPPSQTGEAPNEQYQMPQSQQVQPFPPPPQQQQYQPPPPPYAQLPPPPQRPSLSAVNPPQHQPPPGHPPEETSYAPSQNYSPSIRPPPSHPTGGLSQEVYGTSSQMYEPPFSRPGSGFSGTYGPPSGHGEPYSYSGSPSQYGGGSPMKPHQISSPALGQSIGSGYPQLPTARILSHALPTASGVGGSAGTGNKVPIDDVVDKVTNMGFPRDQVRAMVRKLTENGQSVDLNVVLDKLMNDGDVRSWFGR